MPAAMTFTSLQERMRAYLERGSTDDTTVFEQLPNLINSGERRCARELKIEGFEVPVTFTLGVGVSVYAKPDGWRQTTSMRIMTGAAFNITTWLLPRSFETINAFFPDDTDTDVPKFYADYDYQHWKILPSPDLAYPAECIYWQTPPLLDNSNQTNWLTAFAPDLLLYAALLEAAPFLKNDDRIQTWQSFYDRAAQATSGEDLARILDRAQKRTEA